MKRIILLAAAALGLSANAAELPAIFAQESVFGGLSAPTSFRFLPDGRILLCEQVSGEIRLFVGGAPAANDPLMTVPELNVVGGERGLLSIEIDAQWPARPFVYAYFTRAGTPDETRLVRYTVTGDLEGSGDGELAMDAASALVILGGIKDERSNHNGGDIRFGTDGMLYLSTGDDEINRCEAQDVTSPLGKILRLRVDHLDAGRSGSVARSELVPTDGLNPFSAQGDTAALVWAYGLRNPVRFAVDTADGSLFVCDVGKDRFEEIDHIEEAGVNLGWPHREADVEYNVGVDDCWPEPDPFIYQSPIDSYAHADFPGVALSIMGVAVYRPTGGLEGTWPAGYVGDVFYGEFYRAFVVRLKGSGQSFSRHGPFAGDPADEFWGRSVGSGGLVNFEIGPDDALYVLNLVGGELIRLRDVGDLPTEERSLGQLKAEFEGE